MSEGRRRLASRSRAPANGLTDEDLRIFAQFGAGNAAVALRTRRKTPKEEEDESSESDDIQEIKPSRASTTPKRASARVQATKITAATAKTTKAKVSTAKKSANGESVKLIPKGDLPTSTASPRRTSTASSAATPTKNASSAPTSPTPRAKASASNKSKTSAPTSPSPKKAASNGKKANSTPTSPKGSPPPKKAGASVPLPAALVKRVKYVASTAPTSAPAAKRGIKAESVTTSPTRPSSAEKKRGRNEMTKLSPVKMDVSEPITIVAPPVVKRKLPSIDAKVSSKPPKKKAKLTEAPKKTSSTQTKSTPISWANQLIASQPKPTLPTVLSKKQGVYEWRESDCEEARFYQYCRVWHTQPAHTEAWRNDGANQSEVRENTYGEVTPEGMMPLFEELKFEPEKDIFLDIGSGLGNLVFYASFVKRAKMAYGIEILLSRHNAQLEIRDDLALLGDPTWQPSTCQFVHTTQHDLNLCPGIEKMLGESTIIFCNNLLFSPSSNTQCLTAIQNMALNAKYVVFTSPPLPRDSKRNPAFLRLWRTFEAWDACSWCAKPLTYYVYRPYYLVDGQTTPLPNFRYAPLPLTATSWGIDPLESGNLNSAANGNGVRRQGEVKKKPAKSRFVTEYALIAVPEAERREIKALRRKNIPAEGITGKVVRKSSNAGSSASSTPSPTPLHNLNGDRISFLVPYLEDPEKSYPQMVYEAFNSARICSNRDTL